MTDGVLSRDDALRLLEAARQAANNAYVPYSKFPVGAAILTRDGTVVGGCNVENASYPLTVCAERVAVGNAVAAGHRDFVAIAVTAPKLASVTPCGGCRQVLNEFQPRNAELLVVLDGDEGPEILPLSDLLPRGFGPRSLEAAIGQG